MNQSRLEKLKEFTRSNPTDSFSHYGLAMEYANTGRHEQALETFQKLLAFNPDYTAAYYQAAVLLAKLERVEEARNHFRRGMELAKKQGDFHTLSEMEAALNDLA